MKSRIPAKIGTLPATRIVLWKDKEIKEDTFILAMEESMYNSLHSSYRKLKSCRYWKNYFVNKVREDLIFLSH